MIINYEDYLEGDEWPSESARAVVDETGEIDPALKPVYDMPPQYAASALHKLVRWARDGAYTLEQEESEERRVRSSTLGRLLARKALGIEDFELYSEHGVDQTCLGNQQAAKVLVQAIFNVADMEAVAAAKLATEVALDLNNSGYLIYPER